MKNAKAKVATGVTVVLLGGLGGIALSQGNKAPSKTLADKPVVHTKVIRRTIHVTKHAKPKHPVGAGSAAAAAGTATASGSVTTGSSGSGGGESTPVTTASSGSGGGEYESESGDDHGGGEVEHEGGGDD